MGRDFRFDDIEALLARTDSDGTPSEMHGVLSGLLCLDGETPADQWMLGFFGGEGPSLETHDAKDYQALYEETRRQLRDEDYGFRLLLPDDDESLARRAQALGEWCHGFLQGVGYRGEGADWPAPCGEILADFLEIVRLDAGEAEEEDEVAFSELSEYVRMGVKVIQGELVALTPARHH
jgi:uncharacterized protein YgfB (UPF0149 family)